MCNAWNHSPSCRCGFGGDGHLGGGGYRGGNSFLHSTLPNISTSTSLSKNSGSSGDGSTHPAVCWWCGDEVFFHTNGNGDFVMFDSLGTPWEIHASWQAHREQMHYLS
jgi:hypothetical protein